MSDSEIHSYFGVMLTLGARFFMKTFGNVVVKQALTHNFKLC